MTQFKAVRKTYKLTFEDPELSGLEVRAKSISMGELLAIADQAEAARAGAGLDSVRELVAKFAESLISWNLADEDGVDTPLTADGLLTHDTGLVLDVVLAWFDAIASVAGPLAPRSTNGLSFPVESIPME